MAGELGTIGYDTEVDPSGISGGLARLEAEVKAALQGIDHEEATVTIDANTRALDQKIVATKARVNELKDELDDTKSSMEALAATETLSDTDKAQLKSYKADQAKLNKELREQNSILRDQQLARERTTKAASHIKTIIKDTEKLASTERRLRDASNASALAHLKDAEAVEKMRGRYSALRNELNKLQGGRFRQKLQLYDDVDLQRMRTINAETAVLREHIRQLGGSTKELDDDVQKNNNIIRRWGSSLAGIRLQLGFTSLSIAQLGKALFVLGPIIFSVIGTLSALVGTGLQAVAGAAIAGGAALSGFALGAAGIAFALGPAIDQMKLATAASDAYNKAVITYGKNSDEAETAQKKMNNTLKNVDPAVANAASSLSKLKTRFQDLTDPTRRNIFDALANSLGRANALLPTFATGTNRVSAGLEQAGTNFGRAFDTKSMDTFIQKMMGMTARILPTLGSAFGNLADESAEAFQSAIPWVEKGADGFLKWTQRLNITKGEVDDFMQSLESVIHFTASAGRTLWEFFTAGGDEGRDLLNDMTKGLDDLTRGMRSAEGQKGLDDFFGRSIDLAKDLFHVFSGLGGNLLKLSEAFEPSIELATEFLGFLLDIAKAIQDIPGLGTALNVGVAAAIVSKLLPLGTLFKMLPGRIAATTVAMEGLNVATGENALLGGAGAARGVGSLTGKLGMLAATAGRVAGPLGAIVLGLRELDKETGVFGDGDIENRLSDFEQHIRDVSQSYEGMLDISQKAPDYFDDVFGEGAANDLSTTSRAVEGYGKGLKDVIDDLVRAGKLNKMLRLRIFVGTQGTEQVQKLTRQAANLGGQRQVVNILANSDNAEQAVRRLQNLLDKLHGKDYRANISADDSKAFAAFKRVEAEGDKAEKPRTATIKEQGGQQVFSSLNRIARFNIPDHTATVQVQDLATAALNNVKNLIASIPRSFTVTGHVNYPSNMGPKFSGGVIPGFATGGELRDAHAAARARPPAGPGGGEFTTPRYIVGEEHKKEYVIATNPAYRKANKGYLAMAARDLGYALVPGFAGGGSSYGGGSALRQDRKAHYALSLMFARRVHPAKKIWNGLADSTRLRNSTQMRLALPPGWVLAEDGTIMGTGNYAGGGIPGFAKGGTPKKPKPGHGNGHGNGHGGGNTPASVYTPFDPTPSIDYLFGPRSTYEDLRHNIDTNEGAYSNLERSFSDRQSRGEVFSLTDLDPLRTMKKQTIAYVDQLSSWIDGTMLPTLKRAGNMQISVKGVLPKPPHKDDEKYDPGKKPDKDSFHGKNKDAEYQKALRIWQDKKTKKDNNYQDDLEKWKTLKQELEDRKQSAKDYIPDLMRELEDLANERQGYVLDLEALDQGDLISQGGAGGLPSIDEQIATLSSARFDILKSFGGNFKPIAAAFGRAAAPFGSGFGDAGVAGALGSPATNSAVLDAIAGGGPSGGGPGAAGPGAPAGGVTSGDTGRSVVVNQTNNFPTPPPDPHTFARSTAYDLVAIGA